MGHICFKEEQAQSIQQSEETKKANRKVTVREEEMVIAKLKIQQDRLETRLEKLEKEEQEIQRKIQEKIREKNKEEAYFLLKKMKTTKQHMKDARTKINFIDTQVANIENTLDDVKFSHTIKESNRAIENLSKQIDMEEIRIAKELQEEGKMRREEIDALLEDDDEDAQAIKRELDGIEQGLIQEQFDAHDKNNPTASKYADYTPSKKPQTQTQAEPQAMAH